MQFHESRPFRGCRRPYAKGIVANATAALSKIAAPHWSLSDESGPAQR
jgi:hypothetical protein